jgi:2-desacetyl-2-hydroxyethyl bacteriochlorophyllide A dehydrogenase
MSERMRSVVFTASGIVSVEKTEIPQPAGSELLVKTELSAISAGSELLFYRGQAPADLAADATISALAEQSATYPIRYGYACVGTVLAVGDECNAALVGQRVFAFHPHASHFVVKATDVIPVPGDVATTLAALLPNMETAINFVMDGQPVIGERVAVFGLGVVGLLTTSLLARFPLGDLLCVDPIATRRQVALKLDATDARPPDELTEGDFDLVYELSGAPSVLNQAIAVTGFAGRVVIGSWYGQKSAALSLGGAFHRSRIRLISSQVSTIDPAWSGRWTKARRFDVAWQMLATLPLDSLITHTVSVDDASSAYRLLDESADQALQVLFTYD